MVGTSNSRYQIKFLRDELTDMIFYTYMYRNTEDPELKENFKQLATIENEHANFWGQSLKSSNVDINKITYRKTKYFFMKIIRAIVGKNLIINLLEHGEYQSIKKYKTYLESYKQDDDYKKKVNDLISSEMQHEEIFANKISKSVKNIQKSRDFLYGMSDGLVEVLATLVGLSAIITSHIDIALSGVVVGISGTFSMTLGAYLAQKSESEYKIAMLNRKHIFSRSKGVENMINQYSSEATISALNTAVSYITGAVIPILPFVFFQKYMAVALSVILVFIAQMISNSIVALSLNTPILKSGLRASLLALGAAAATFAAGEIFHIIFHISLL
ncbi:VIT1/CCC1 transporter family protein [Ferroplasma acidiphilum]|uniref:Rubrerythrin family protein n=1 Tax=Ferroplasma acidiphilum TaxID=74969 RepID=A0A7K4FNQ2_9ARCH|nr:VIT1/CCC1 family protein [Ferroplasma acidiphilum]NOL60642.1 rubrerythrin family protein [Ferroplasma acidiphilum]